MIERSDLRVYFIMGSMNTKRDPIDILEKAISGGITAFQYREKGPESKTGEGRFKLGLALRNSCLKHQIPFIVNDDIELAMRLQADGVHIGQDDESLLEVKKRLPSYMAVGVSVSTVEEAKLAEERGATYLGVGPMYQTTTKVDARRPVGVDRLQEIAGKVATPVVAIGGITSANTSELIQAGAAGVSVISAISSTGNPEEAAKKLVCETRLLAVE